MRSANVQVTMLLRILLSAILLCASLLCTSLAAQTPPTLQIPPAAQANANFSVEAATRAYLDTFADRKAKSDAYFEGGYWLVLWDFLYGAAVALMLLGTGLSARMRDFAERLSRRKAVATWLYFAQYLAITSIIGAPLGIYEGFLREKKYDLMNQNFLEWTIDQFKSLGLGIVLGGLVVVALFGIVRRLPRTWHIWGAMAATAFLLMAALIFPVFIAPMFNKYTILADAHIRDPILSLARQNGIPATKVYEVDASKQSKRASANVSGVLGTERITLNDNLLKRSSPEAIQAVMGHEMGHYVMNHVYKGVLIQFIVFGAFFAILRGALTGALKRWGGRWGLRDLGDPAVIPLVILILSALFFVGTPLLNTVTRTMEYEADIFGLSATRQPDGFAEAALMLGEYRKLEPTPVEEFIFFDHPSGRTRIFSSMRWKKENLCLFDAKPAAKLTCGH